MALVTYNPISQFSGKAANAIHAFIGGLFGQPITADIEDWLQRGKYTRQVPSAKLISTINIPIFKPGLERWDGNASFEERSNIFAEVRRGTYKKGSKVNTIQAAEIDFSGWTMSPGVMNTEIGNNIYKLAAACLNGCFSGTPQDAAGNVLGFPEIICTDQIYGGKMAVLNIGTTSDTLQAWAANTAYTVGDLVTNNSNLYECITAGTSAGSGGPTTTSSDITDNTAHWAYVSAAPSLKLINPADPSVLNPSTGSSGWYNAKQNWDITPDNILNSIKNHQTRCAMNGVELGLGQKGVEIWTPFLSQEDARLLVEVMQQLAGSGQLGFSPIVVGGSTVTFASQTNPVYGRATVKPIHGMRSDLWCVVSPPPSGRPEFAIFLEAFGGANGSYEVNPDGYDGETNDSVPHIALFTFDKNSAMHFGVPGVSSFGDIGVMALVNEGIATQSGLLIDFNFTGDAS